MLSGVPNCLPLGNPVLKVQGLRGELFIDKLTGNFYKYDYNNMKFISVGEVDYDVAEYLRSFLNDWE